MDVRELSSAAWQVDGQVSAIVSTGGRTYLAGSFTGVRPPGAAPGERVVRRTHLAAVDSTTGALLPWAPAVDRPVRTLALSPDGATLYAGGGFTRVDGGWRQGTAAFRTGSGALTGFTAPVVGAVHAIAVTAGRVYLGGAFSRVHGQPRSRLAAVDRSGDLVDGWAAPTDGVVRALALGADGTSLYAGGDFTRIAGDPAQRRLARLSRATGAALPFLSRPAFPVWSVAVTRDRVHVGGDGAGGHVESFRRDGSRAWTRQTDGAVQGLAVRDGVLYVGGHFAHLCLGDAPGGASGGGFTCSTVEARRQRLLALDGASGRLLAWDPRADTPLGVLALDGAGQRLRVGGTFDHVGGRAQQGYGAFAPRP